MTPKVDDLINGKYRLVRRLGEGGMGSVFEATHEGLRTRVAIKFLHAELSHRNEVVQRFVQEARLVASIKSPHVVQVNDVETTSDGTAFIVLEFLEGKTLQRLLSELHHAGKRLGTKEALDLAVQMLEGAEAAHKAGVVHRDLKPDNVMIIVGPQGEPFVKLVDFGIAKPRGGSRPGMTRPGVVMGTPEYMAPEQAFSSESVDARADVFALGVMVFEMLADGRPLAGDDPQVLAASHLAGEVPNLATIEPSLPAGLAEVVHKAMAARPPDRFPNASEFLDALRPFALGAASVQPSAPDKAPATPYASTEYAGNAASRLPSSRPSASGGTSAMASFHSDRPPSGLRNKTGTELMPIAPGPSTRPAQNVVPDSASPQAANPYARASASFADPSTTGPRVAPPPPSDAKPLVPASAPSEPAPAALDAPKTSVRGLWIGLLVMVVVLLAVAVGLFVVSQSRENDDHPRRPPHVQPAHHPARRR